MKLIDFNLTPLTQLVIDAANQLPQKHHTVAGITFHPGMTIIESPFIEPDCIYLQSPGGTITRIRLEPDPKSNSYIAHKNTILPLCNNTETLSIQEIKELVKEFNSHFPIKP